MEQLSIFEVDKIEQSIDKFNQLIKKDELPFDLVAVNKMYSWSAVVYDRVNKSLSYVIANNDAIKREYPVSNEFGPNYHLVDQCFSKHESVELTNEKRQYTTCARRDLDRYLADGWVVEQ